MEGAFLSMRSFDPKTFDPKALNWKSSSTHVLFNPRMPETDREGIEQRLHQLKPLESHLWLATSGSTAQVAGQLKWIALSKSAILASAQAVNEHLAATSQDVWVTVLPTFHVGGIGIYARAHLSGARIIDGLLHQRNESPKWDAKHFHQMCLKNHGTLSALVPTQVYDLIQAKLQAPKTMRAIVIGGAALSESLYQEALKLGWPLLPSYGMTECCSQIATASLESLKANPPSFPAFQLLSHVKVNQSLEGKFKVQSPSLLTGLAVLSSEGDRWLDPKVDGWFQSEDMGEIISSPQSQFLTVRGRSSDFVKIGGESVDLNRLAAVLTEVRTQVDSAIDLVILPMADERLGSVIHGVAAADERNSSGDKAKRIFDQFNSRVLPYERVRKLHYVETIPRSPLQKLLKSELIALLGARSLHPQEP
jgi:O-succinylbenzoic acid--CoA ligase